MDLEDTSRSDTSPDMGWSPPTPQKKNLPPSPKKQVLKTLLIVFGGFFPHKMNKFFISLHVSVVTHTNRREAVWGKRGGISVNHGDSSQFTKKQKTIERSE